jgi:hypothetical protein
VAYTQADRDALRAALATGALSVRYADGRSVTYRTVDEMMRLDGLMAADIATAAGAPALPRAIHPGIASGSY